jgi:hypothetical protein
MYITNDVQWPLRKFSNKIWHAATGQPGLDACLVRPPMASIR